ncbi:type II toxin-antitoxin system VapB family antitoxin [Haematomicrobium sanguinis]|uniref:type II toxin-antitoxin system VapB family antitoxin n=1 Tax=Haematomicrobium sanguinis TaxID=479106 RepID=UPI00047A2201|nr:type II toxin-antitoxin system VapB family antitoxin [Haematomicrobium sanguinis]
MGLNIKNERVHGLVKDLASLTGQSQTSAIEEAVMHRISELRKDAAAPIRSARFDAIREAAQTLIARMPAGFDPERANEELYDERGLPR